MKLSGFDKMLLEMDSSFIYAGYSAAGCVLSPSLKGYALVDDASLLPYPQLNEQLWDGLGLIDFVFLPHYDSDHPESSDVDKELAYCKENALKYKTLTDGDVLLIGF